MRASSRLNRFLVFLAALCAPLPGYSAGAATILFVGNSFTEGARSPARKFHADTVTDLNGSRIGGVPALFKLFAAQSGLDYQVSLETEGGKDLEWHWENRLKLIDRPWDFVVLQDYSTIDRDKPGDPARLVAHVHALARLFTRRNPKVDLSLMATWSRPDMIYRKTGFWNGQSIYAMALDVRRGYERAAARSRIERIIPVGQAFNCAIAARVADFDPYDGISQGQIGLWASDNYHASAEGSYLAALTVFASITGRDPRSLGAAEAGAAELKIAPANAVRLQQIAWQATRPYEGKTVVHRTCS